mmetsp:Transcript_108747/g.307430  ORF Transcript_108747/g.307430 Transcript_108747/m.307430 type:complete len:334 (+) Transcript_108747:165-1166(+)
MPLRARVAGQVEHGCVLETRGGPLHPALLLRLGDLGALRARFGGDPVAATLAVAQLCLRQAEGRDVAPARAPVLRHPHCALRVGSCDEVVVDATVVLRPDGSKDFLRRSVNGAEEALVPVVQDVYQGREAAGCVLVRPAEAGHPRQDNDVEGLADGHVVVGPHVRLAQLGVGKLPDAHAAEPGPAAGQAASHGHGHVVRLRRLVAAAHGPQRGGQARVGRWAQGPEEAALAVRGLQLHGPGRPEVPARGELHGVAVPQDRVDERLEDLAVDPGGVQLVRGKVGRCNHRAAGLEQPLEEGAHDHGIANIQDMALIEAKQGRLLQKALGDQGKRI